MAKTNGAILTSYEKQHLALLEQIVAELKRIADGIHGDILEPEEVYSEETLNLLNNSCMTPKETHEILENMWANNFSPTEMPEGHKKI
jgi:hypothetical protein